jgi:hypothetical protein
MSTEEDCLWSFLGEAAKPDLPFFPPLPQADAPPPDAFDAEFEGLEFEGVQLPENPFSQFRGNTPVFISPSVFTHSTESGYDFTASEYSYGYLHSKYSMPSDIAFQNVRVSSEYGGVDAQQTRPYPPAFNDLTSFGPLPPTPSPSPPLCMEEAQSDYGPSKYRQGKSRCAYVAELLVLGVKGAELSSAVEAWDKENSASDVTDGMFVSEQGVQGLRADTDAIVDMDVAGPSASLKEIRGVKDSAEAVDAGLPSESHLHARPKETVPIVKRNRKRLCGTPLLTRLSLR